jgi:MFS family permease
MRATASAFYLLVITFVGLALGPYSIGLVSDRLGDLRQAMLLALFANGLGCLFVCLAARTLERDETTRTARARAAGEPDARAMG